MSDVNSENAVMREKARIREEVLKLFTVETKDYEQKDFDNAPTIIWIKREDVLKIIR